MNQVLQPPLSLASDNPFSSEQDCIGQIDAHTHHHSSFVASAVPDPLRREGVLAHTATGNPLGPITGRYGAPRSDTGYHSVAGLSDSGSGASTSPSSNASSALYNYSPFNPTHSNFSTHYPLSNNYGNYFGNTALNQSRRIPPLIDPSSSAMLPPTRSPGLSHSVSPSMVTSTGENYTTASSGLQSRPQPLSPRYSENSNYNTLPTQTRSVLSTPMPLSQYPYSQSSYARHHAPAETPPFMQQETNLPITCDGTKIVPTIEAKIEKGFFLSSDHVWTCYRRNYFAVNVSFTLTPWTPNGRLYIEHNGKEAQIQSMAVSLAAAVDQHTGKTIELIQHTPKRDKGPQLPMKKELLAPMPPGKSLEHSTFPLGFHQSTNTMGPQLPLQTEADSSQQYSPANHGNSSYQHAFERIQFKSATANNGKRRAQQQYYHLIVELWANIQSLRDQEPRWVKIASRCSQPVVVRGRSPSHYSNEGPHNTGSTRGSGGSGLGGAGSHSLGSIRSHSYTTYGNGLSSSGATMGGNLYRGNTYSLDPSPVGSHSVSSASSLSGGPAEGIVGEQHLVDEDDAKMIDASHDYQYYPAPIYEAMPPKMDHLLPLPERRVKEECSGSAAITAGWQVGGCGRFQGLETSRGLYPDVHAHAGY